MLWWRSKKNSRLRALIEKRVMLLDFCEACEDLTSQASLSQLNLELPVLLEILQGPPPESLPGFQSLLDSKTQAIHYQIRCSVARALGKARLQYNPKSRQEAEAWQALAESSLEDPHPWVREVATEALLLRLPPVEEFFPVLQTALRSQKPQRIQSALRMATGIPQSLSLQEEWLLCLSHSELEVKMEACRALGRMAAGAVETGQPLTGLGFLQEAFQALLLQEKPQLRWLALESIAWLGPDPYQDILFQQFQQLQGRGKWTKQVDRALLFCLLRLKNKENHQRFVKQLLQRLPKASSWPLDHSLAFAALSKDVALLSKHFPEEALRLLRAPSKKVRRKGLELCRRLFQQRPPQESDWEKLRYGRTQEEQTLYLEWLGEARISTPQDQKALDFVLSLGLNSRFSTIRQRCGQLLGEEAQEAQLLRHLENKPNRLTRQRVLEMLQAFPLDSIQNLQVFQGFLTDPSARLRKMALESVATLGDSAIPAIPGLLRRIFDGDPSVRQAARDALVILQPSLPEGISSWIDPADEPILPLGALLEALLASPAFSSELESQWNQALADRLDWRARSPGKTRPSSPMLSPMSPDLPKSQKLALLCLHSVVQEPPALGAAQLKGQDHLRWSQELGWLCQWLLERWAPNAVPLKPESRP